MTHDDDGKQPPFPTDEKSAQVPCQHAPTEETGGYSAEDIDRLTAADCTFGWEAWDDDQKLTYLLTTPLLEAWENEEAIALVRRCAVKDHQWLRIKHAYKRAGGHPLDLEKLAIRWRKEEGTPRTACSRAVRRRARDILAQEFLPLIYVVEEILPAGCTLLTGKSKDGKSLMAYDLTVAVASGGQALGRYNVTPGSVWYLALEDGERRVQHRLALMQRRVETELSLEAQDKIEFTTWKAPRLGEGLEEEILDWIATTPDARLLIIDILEKVRPLRKPHGNGYAQDYEPTAALTELAQERNIAILIIHHANKLNPDDFRDSASGCMSLIGGADNFWSLRRMPGSEEATLGVIGRDIEHEQELAMEFKDGYWTALGEANMVRLSPERQDIVDALLASPKPLPPNVIAKGLGKNVSTITLLLRKLLKAGVVIQPTEGRYAVSPTYLTQTRKDRKECKEHTECKDRKENVYGEHDVFTGVFTGDIKSQVVENAGQNGSSAGVFTVFTPFTASTSNGTATDCYPPPAPDACCPTWVCRHNPKHTDHWHNAGHEATCQTCHPQAFQERRCGHDHHD